MAEDPQDAEKKIKKKKIAIKEPSSPGKRRITKRQSIFPEFLDNANIRLTASSIDARSSGAPLYRNLLTSGFPSIASRRWTSQRSTMYLTPRFQNTYRLESRYPFRRGEVEAVVNRYLGSFLHSYHYIPKRAKRLAENLSIDLKNTIKRCHFERYRIVTWVTVGDKFHQDFKASMRFLWDADKDGYVDFAFDGPNFFVVALICAVYYE
ncbi:dynein light chain Tctex-type protein 2B-like [Toxorhynchites rutilus septentrionalis]|uniref:dynein light chain Tctex-type protein 2B-like n=1 Tax=Toxorhynchites rutilus septentrionalis TaxID=329112 RepID=UPI0024799EED|nr:dynein light chain Tctex-type protein 2B-like [Toxorhynchites rutilus septentrionalis]